MSSSRGGAFDLHSLIYGSSAGGGGGGGAAGGGGLGGGPQPRRKRKRKKVKEDNDDESSSESSSSSSSSDSSSTSSHSPSAEQQEGGSTKKKDFSSQVEKEEMSSAAAVTSNPATSHHQLLHVVDRSSNFLRTVYDGCSSEAIDKKKNMVNSNTTTNEEDKDVMPHQVTSQQSQSQFDHDGNNVNNNNRMIALQPSIRVRKPKRKKKRYAMIKYGKVASNIDTAVKQSLGVGGRAKHENLLHENSKEYKIREARVARQLEWACSIRSKWKNRKYDLRQEPDIGNAIQRVVQTTQERQKKLQPEIGSGDNNDSTSSSDSSSSSDDDDNEQANILKRLLRHSQQEEQDDGDKHKKKKRKRKRAAGEAADENDSDSDDSDDDNENDSVFIPYTDKLNYWELGRHQPRYNQINVKYNVDTVLSDTIPNNLVGLQTGTQTGNAGAGLNNKSTKRPHYRYRYNQKLKLCPSGLVTFYNDNDDYNIIGDGGNYSYATALGKRSTYHKQLTAESYQRNYYLGQGQNHSIYTKPKFVHQRQLVRLAARHLIVNNNPTSTTASATNVDHTLLQSLWDTDLIQDSNRSHLVMTQANLYGRFLDFYLRHTWTSSPSSLSVTEVEAAAEAARVDIDDNTNEVNGGKKKKGRQQRAATVAASAGNKEVAETLGIAYSEYGVPPSWSGWTTYPKTLYEYWRESEHPKLLSKYRPTPVPWSNTAAAAAAAASIEANNNNSYKRQLFIHPNVYYVPVPGAVPPSITECSPPLDITNVVFGPFDKYHYVFHKSDKVNHASYALTMSYLLSKKCSTAAAAANSESENFNDIEQQQQQWDTAMTTITERCANQLTSNKLYKRLKNYAKSNEIDNQCSMIEELPLSAYAKSVRAYCSLLAAPATRPNNSATSSSGGGASSGGALFAPTADDTAANTKFDFDSLDVEKWVEHNGLNLFSSLHVTFGLFHISRSLPTGSCVELLSRPLILSGGYWGCDNRNNNDNSSSGAIEEVPMERIKQLLEYMENEHLLIDNINHNASHHHNHKAVVVGELEYAFHYALKNCFGKSLERDPTNVDYHCWYLAVLAGSLLLCSGNRIGSSGSSSNARSSNDNCAHPYPSYSDPSTADQSQSLFDDDLPSLSLRNDGRLRPDEPASSSSTSPPAHEIRRRLPKFCELRKETAEVFQLMLRLSSCYDHNQDSSTNRCHRAIASFLEWKQVVALLVGVSGGDNDRASSTKKRKKKKREEEQVVNSAYRDICRLHADHMYQWALSENTATSQSYLKQAVNDNSSSKNSADCNEQKKYQILNAYACALEEDPSSKMNWLLLISELGPLGTKSEATMSRPPPDQEELEQQNIEICQECSDRLVPGYHCSNIHHNDKAISGSSNGEDNSWWGTSRKDWWNDNLLRLQNAATVTTTTAADEEELLQLLSTTVADALEGALAASTTLDEDVQEVEGSGNLDGAVPSSTTASGEQAPSSNNNNNDNGISLQWLDDVISTALQQDNNEKPPSYRARKRSVDHKLPRTFQEVLGGASSSSSLEDQDDEEEEDYQQQMSLSISSSVKQQFLFTTTTASGGSSDHTKYTEMLCYKLLIRSHLYGLLDDHVEIGIKQLALECYSKHSKDQIQSDSVAFVALQYLYRMHINVPQILRGLRANAATTRK